MSRPTLNPSISFEEFKKSYWLKVELQNFCRKQALPISGSKIDVTKRIEAFLTGKPLPESSKRTSPQTKMPARFEEKTIIESGWRCTQSLRSYFREVHGAGFSFNGHLREFIRTGAGKTLAEASLHYEASLKQPRKPIDKQFEYNRHTREFFETNPNATRQEAIDAWWVKRGRPEV